MFYNYENFLINYFLISCERFLNDNEKKQDEIEYTPILEISFKFCKKHLVLFDTHLNTLILIRTNKVKYILFCVSPL